MRKAWITVVALAFIAASALAQEVTSVNVAGIIKVHLEASEIAIIGVNLDAIDPADATLEGVLGGKLRAGDFPGDGDRVWVWDTGAQEYQTYQIYSGDGLFHAADDLGEWFGAAVNPVILPGAAFWIAASSVGPVDFSFTGQAVSEAEASVPVVPGLQFLTYPLSAVINIQDTDFENDGATNGPFPGDGDRIWIWTGAQYETYGLKSDDNQWYPADDLGEWFGAQADIDLNLGQGFWYVSNAASTWNWTEANPYLGNL